jgi:hypothetical protein
MNTLLKMGVSMDQATAAATAASYVTSGTVLVMGLSADQWSIAAAIAGITGIVVTAVFNIWFKMKYGR